MDPEVDPTQNDPERVLLNEEFLVDSEGVMSNMFSMTNLYSECGRCEILTHFVLAVLIFTLVICVLQWINGPTLNVTQDGQCERLLGWKCPLNLSTCKGIIFFYIEPLILTNYKEKWILKRIYKAEKVSNFLHSLLGYRYTINVFGLKDDICTELNF